MNMVKFIISVLVVYFLYRIFKKVGQLKPADNKDHQQPQFSSGNGEELMEDPVCHTYVPVSQAYKKEMAGKVYYFCSKQCSDKYTLNKDN
ncbi:MAG TPA: YHS domain-containing protein [Smithella sp.]|nr:YHS domain-containing protein [Smithella sp.]MDM7987986.1 YHS domain-containing protein [Smithella sp.]HNY49998.1 YHS domain-containing protein [Smithella sp.]HOU50088.1 YHS domain-containing protein [Smithella sp.]HQG65888.1 YHS domain-containing protein [Smithella sp.]